MRRHSWASLVALVMGTAFLVAPDRAWSAVPPGAIDAVQAGGLQAALDALPATGGTVFIPAGRHIFAKPVVKRLQEGQHLFLVGEGRASVLVNENREGQELLHIVGIVGQSWPDLKITIRDLTFLGNHQSGDGLVVDHRNAGSRPQPKRSGFWARFVGSQGYRPSSRWSAFFSPSPPQPRVREVRGRKMLVGFHCRPVSLGWRSSGWFRLPAKRLLG